ncbi:MAG: NAD(P)/FAD-dependent oxidoreductase [Anaerolineae bacterium]|nr:NAD(P)/FAD-dependent oxidoreductase [Anaerolineae bacterium]
MTNLVIIGAGPAGITAALEAARLGADVTLIEREYVGGRANWHSLLPSKVWLSAADRLSWRHEDVGFGLPTSPELVDYRALTAHIAVLSKRMGRRYYEQLEAVGVTIRVGAASFVDPRHILVQTDLDEHTLPADVVIIATGSGPIFLPQVKPDGQRIIAPRLMGKFTQLPKSMAVIGAGATGAEFAYLFCRLGARVEWITDLPEILPRSDADIKGKLAGILAAQGVTIHTNSPVSAAENTGEAVTITLADGRTLETAMAFLAIGRHPSTDGLNLEAVGLDGSGGLAVDAFGQTAAAGIYAAGDITGPPMTANKGIAQGYIAARHALGAAVKAYRADTVVEAVYTAPQIAQVGLTEADAAAQSRPVRVIRRDYGDNLKAHLEGEPGGFLKLLVDPDSEAILGGAAVGAHAADVIAPVAVALAHDLTLADLRPVYAGYPTFGELAFDAARGD